LHKKQYCIFNKQYTKEEYEALVPKIIAQMNEVPYIDKKGRVYKYGEFFPAELSFFAYNETLAFGEFPLTKEEALAEGYRWKEAEEKDYKITLQPESIPDNIKDVTDDILKESIGCAHKGECSDRCTTAFRLTKNKLDFYKANNIPIPRLCHNCRHVRRVKNQSSMKLWHRKCAKCGKDIETSYAPDRPETVYCKQCYNEEVA
jgi:CxxC-x17-CxxC domain-containing protein